MLVTKSPTNYLKTHWIFLFFCLLYSLYQGHIVIYIICGSPFILIFFSLPLLPYFLLIPFYPYFLLYTPSSLFLPMFLCILILYPYPFCVVLLTSCAPIILRVSKFSICGQCFILSTLRNFFICVFQTASFTILLHVFTPIVRKFGLFLQFFLCRMLKPEIMLAKE